MSTSRVKQPTDSTLRRYGLTASEWFAMADDQDWRCAVCRRLPKNRMLNIDHQHVKGWKRMPPHQRRQHVRGLVCPFCNHYMLGRYTTIETCQMVLAYLMCHADRSTARPGELF